MKVVIRKDSCLGHGQCELVAPEVFEVRERKQSLFQVSSDPFDVVAGRHRQSISGVASSASAAATRRRSSAVAPDAAAAVAAHGGYQGDKLAPIESRPEIPPVNFGNTGFAESGTGKTDADAVTPVTTGTGTNGAAGGEHRETVVTHEDPDSVAPHVVP